VRLFRPFCLLFAALCWLPAANAALSKQQARALFVEANELFRQANETSRRDTEAAHDLYLRAALRFERIIEEGGIRNGKLYYNLGNAYFRAGGIGRAILNYRRAAQLIPSDPNLCQNLAYARGTRTDSFQQPEQQQVLKALLFWHYDLSPRLRSLLFGALSLLFWSLASVRLFRPGWISRKTVGFCAAAALLFLGSLLAEAYQRNHQEPGVIVAREVVARKGDGESYEPSFKEPLHAGTEFVVVENRGEWLQIELPDSRRCWVPASAAELIDAQPASAAGV